ncbi:uncharacterized protein LOC134830401 [Culicoides brevitarsis]|uniref:uncharacterized protein LOC134830401 n=1 Tax=Culicoides brevitarsis TaxID=469753 RepID=UPI00307CC1E2
MSKKPSPTKVLSPAKVKRSASDETKLKKIYDEQELNKKMGLELYGISEKMNPIEPIPGEMQNHFLDYEINEVVAGKPCVLGDTIFGCRVPPGSNLDEIRKLEIIKQGLVRPDTFRAMLRKIDSFQKPSDCFNIHVDTLSDDQVRELHKGLQILTDLEKNLIVFETKTAAGSRVLRVMPHKGGPMTNEDLKKWGWDPEYIHFTLQKRNIPFKRPLIMILDTLNLNKKDLGFAQLKEAGAVSTQRISVPKVAVNKLQKLTKQDKFSVGNFEIRSDEVKIGDLDGNRYRIVFRGLSSKNKEQVNEYEECLKFLERNGFINYFGVKRFMKKTGVPAYQIGKALLTRNFEEAINLIMTPTKDDPSELRDMKERWALSDGSPIKTLEGSEALEREFEYKLVKQLERNPDDLVEALEKVPLNIRLAYIFAYQSYIWNIIASQRIKRKGLKLFVGDIVLVNSLKPLAPEFFEDFSIGLTSRSAVSPPFIRDPKKKPNFKDAIKFVTQEDIDEQRYTIHDLVLPLPGSEVSFPKNNDVGIWYTDFLSKDGLNKTRLSDKYCINGNQIVQNTNYFLHGTYRKLLVFPTDLQWEFKPYKRLSDNLLDKDKSDRPKPEDTDKLALVMEFTLPADSYVQMAIREVVDLDKSGFTDVFLSSKKAHEEELKEMEQIVKEKKRERDSEREKSEKDRDKRPKVVERLDGGIRKERLDGGISKNKRDSQTRSQTRSLREVSQTSSARRARSREVLDGRRRASRSRSPNISRRGSREVLRNSSSRIEVRVDNDMHRLRSRSNERFMDNRPTSFDGIPICEFNTLPQEPDIDDSFNNASRNLSMRGDFHLDGSNSRVWDSQEAGRFDPRDDRPRFEPDMDRGVRQSVFDGRLEPRPIMRNPDPPEILEPGRLLQPPQYFHQNQDDLRSRLNAPSNSSPYDIDREFDRFEQEVQELNRDCRRDQEIRLREALEQEERMRYGRLEELRRPADEPLSPQIAEKLRRLDEEALRLDLKRVTRLQNFDASTPRHRDDRDFDRRQGNSMAGRDFGDDRNMGMTREQVMNRNREMEEFDRNFLMDRVNNDRRSSRDRMSMDRFEQRDLPPPRFVQELPFGRDGIRSPSPSHSRKSLDLDRSFDRGPLNDDRFRNDDRFGPRNMDQGRQNDFMGGNNNFGPRDSSDLRNSLSRNPQQMSNFNQMPQQGQFSGMNPNQRDQYNNRNFQNSNQFRNDGPPPMMMNQQRGMDNSWNRQNSPPPRQNFPQQQWMNQENPNFNPNNGGPMNFGGNFGGNNYGGNSFQGGPNQGQFNNSQNPNMFNNPNQMMGGNGPPGGMGMNFPNNGGNMRGSQGMMMQDNNGRPKTGPPGFKENRRKSRFN